jgi:hypothetical protein
MLLNRNLTLQIYQICIRQILGKQISMERFLRLLVSKVNKKLCHVLFFVNSKAMSTVSDLYSQTRL